MKRILYLLCLLLTVSCHIGKNYPKVVWVDMCESVFPVDSANEALAAQKIPMKFAEEGNIGMLLLDKYVIMIDKEDALCICSIEETRDLYVINAQDYLIAGFNISIIYDKEHATIYKTDAYNTDQDGFNMRYETCDFDNGTIEVQYFSDNSIEKVHFSKCTSDTVKLSVYL
jgi:hypothetical protein